MRPLSKITKAAVEEVVVELEEEAAAVEEARGSAALVLLLQNHLQILSNLTVRNGKYHQMAMLT
jgi:O-acetylhomoserine/O-acetylserine sulfhydrylase-like pyridoxal-dependent enzyme